MGIIEGEIEQLNASPTRSQSQCFFYSVVGDHGVFGKGDAADSISQTGKELFTLQTKSFRRDHLQKGVERVIALPEGSGLVRLGYYLVFKKKLTFTKSLVFRENMTFKRDLAFIPEYMNVIVLQLLERGFIEDAPRDALHGTKDAASAEHEEARVRKKPFPVCHESHLR